MSTIEVYGEADYKLGGVTTEKAGYSFWAKQNQYNQADIAPSGCAFFSGLGALGDVTGIQWTDDDFNKLKGIAPQYGRGENNGMYIYKAVDMIRKRWNDGHPNDTVSTYNVGLGSDDFYNILNLGYSIQTGYRGNQAYNNDAWHDGDCILLGNDFGTTTYGHCIRITRQLDNIFVVDNYYPRKCNIYKINDLKGLIANKVFFNSGYFYIPKINVKMPETTIILPEHINPTLSDPQSREIILAWEQEMTKVLQANTYKLKFNNYTDDFTITKMLIDLSNIR